MRPSSPRDDTNPLMLPLTECAGRLKTGALTARAYAAAVVAAAQTHQQLNAYAAQPLEQLRRAAEAADQAREHRRQLGLVHGIPLILKDNINTRELPTSAGTPALSGNNPGSNAPVAERLFAAGALLAGKSNMHELSCGGTSNNHCFGTVRNPYAPHRTPGGSSGGTAAAVAARLVPGGLGTDTSGSVRVPAALCGVVGLRPSAGRYPGSGIVPISGSFDTAGPIARSVADVALLDSAISGDPVAIPTATAAGLRLGIPYGSLVETASEAVATVFARALQRCAESGITLVPVDLTEIRKLTRATAGPVISHEFPDVLAEYLRAHAPAVSIDQLAEQIASPAVRRFTRERLLQHPDHADYQLARSVRLPTLRQAHRDLYARHGIHALAFPTAPDIALPHAGDDDVLRNGTPTFSWFYFSNTSMASIAGNPSLTVPAGLCAEGLPVGFSVDGLPGADRQLLGIGQLLETVLGPLPPPVLQG